MTNMKNTLYQRIKQFMEEYFESYSKYAQDEENMPKMDIFWTEDFKTTAYMQLKDDVYPLQFHDRKTWQDFLIEGHLKIIEILKPTDVMIDTEEMKVAAKLLIQKFDRDSGKKLCNLDGLGYYTLKELESGNLILESLDFYCGDPAQLSNLYNI
jgi:hypothetical protein